MARPRKNKILVLYMLLSRKQNAGQNQNIKIANTTSENVVKCNYLGTIVTNQNLIQEEIKRRLNSGNACCHSIQNLLSFLLLSKNIKTIINKTIIRMRVFENRVLRRIFGLKMN
ncbi:hypothetical protein B7P43_G05206 [Cryptotermes secundus]|uniref:Uncharacterized protein n=1 Tax=Cryptotermes secundus TaxID=105785 RepID=A0A2J7QQP8_9NEOP|nr:hypothetical protein B7P43_G05206 [Cryptotermes secundus]